MRTTAGATLACALALVLAPRAALAQATLSGTAEWTLADSGSTSNAQSSADRSLWQNYTLGFSSSLFDPRIVKYDTEMLFRTSRLAASGSDQVERQGHQQDLGYQVGVSLFQASAFPFFVQASRTFSGNSGELGASSSVPGLIGVPGAGPSPSFETENRLVSLGGQLNLSSVRFETGYRQGATIATGGSNQSTQTNGDLSASATKDSSHTRQSLRFQRSSFANIFSQNFSQRLSNLDYDFSSLVGLHTRVTAHGGWRTSTASTGVPPRLPDSLAAPYAPPILDGKADSKYVSAGMSYEPAVRLVVRVGANADQQTATAGAAGARLVTASAHLVVVRGLSVTANGTTGTREQSIANTLVTVATRTGTAGATYEAGVRWLQGSVGAVRGIGTNETPEGRAGRDQSWSREASLSSTLRWISMGAGYERVSNRDEILDYGNYESQRIRASVQANVHRLSVSTSADELRISRGLMLTVASASQRSFSGSATYRFSDEFLGTATAGGFTNDSSSVLGPDHDRVVFWSVGEQTTLRRNLRASASVRSDDLTSARTNRLQRGLSGFGRVEYRLRTVSLSLEYRRSNSLLQYNQLISPDSFRGRQFRFSLTRHFGIRL